MEQTFQLTLDQTGHILKKTNQGIETLNIQTMNSAFNLGIDEILKEIAIHNIKESLNFIEIQSECIYHETWKALEKVNEQMHEELLQNVDEVTEKSFIQGFMLGYKMLKSIKER